MITYIKVLLCFFSLFYGIIGLNEEKSNKGFIALLFIVILLATEVWPL